MSPCRQLALSMSRAGRWVWADAVDACSQVFENPLWIWMPRALRNKPKTEQPFSPSVQDTVSQMQTFGLVRKHMSITLSY